MSGKIQVIIFTVLLIVAVFIIGLIFIDLNQKTPTNTIPSPSPKVATTAQIISLFKKTSLKGKLYPDAFRLFWRKRSG